MIMMWLQRDGPGGDSISMANVLIAPHVVLFC